MVAKGKYKVWMWERCQTKTNLLRLIPYTVAVAPAACGQLDPCLNIAGNSSPSIPPPIPFSFFLGSNGTENKQSDINGPPQLKSCFCLSKRLPELQDMLKPCQKSPQYLPMPTTGCGVQEAALKSQ